MIVTFQSAAAGDVIMFGDVAQRLMGIMGKEASDKGIVTVEQLPEAIARLKAAIAEDKTQRAQRAAVADADGPQSEPDPNSQTGQRPFVSLAQRAVPLLELLEFALKKKKPVVWGV